MPNKVGRNYLNLCFTKIKKTPILTNSDSHQNRRPLSTATATVTATATATAFIKNYNSLYEYGSHSTSSSSNFSDNDDPESYVVADFLTAYTSRRFFFSSPGRSNSIIESSTVTRESTTSSSSTTTSDYSGDLVLNNSVAIPTYSPDPYTDFRRSMEEMMEAREQITEDVEKSNSEFLHELLLCYLALNPKSAHKYILGAFADLTGVMKMKPALSPPPEAEDVICDCNRESELGAGGGCEKIEVNKMIAIDRELNYVIM